MPLQLVAKMYSYEGDNLLSLTNGTASHRLTISTLITFVFRRMNELKSSIDIPDDVILKFKQFWLEFKDAPLKGNRY